MILTKVGFTATAEGVRERVAWIARQIKWTEQRNPSPNGNTPDPVTAAWDIAANSAP